ncbi:hypothetical protein FGRMN_10712 [Fusarium graminum]|nr:hypothetical protein FGRMN_10712 [Fusarium graminum]
MKLTYWAICSLALVAGVFGVESPELFKGLPDCTAPCLAPNGTSGSDTVDICHDKILKHERDICFARECNDLDRFEITKINAKACDHMVKSNRLDHYILLIAEIPAWISPWLRLYSSWTTYETLSMDDYAMMLCGLLYTVFATLVHFGYSATSTTIVWNTAPEYITDGLKIVFMAEIFELACSCLLRVAILLVCLRTALPGQHMIITGITIIFTLFSSVVLAMLRVFRCSPIELAWEGWAQHDRDQVVGGCLPPDSLAYAASAIDIFLNITIFVMLVRLIASRRTRGTSSWVKQIMAVILGVFVLGVSSFRAQLLANFYTTMRPVWEYHERIIWMDVEISALIIWASLPTWQSFADSSSRHDIDDSSQPVPLIGKPSQVKARSVIRRTGFFGFLANERTRKQVEPNLFLGDKTFDWDTGQDKNDEACG